MYIGINLPNADTADAWLAGDMYVRMSDAGIYVMIFGCKPGPMGSYPES